MQGFRLHFFPQLKLWVNDKSAIELTHNFLTREIQRIFLWVSCGKKNKPAKKISTILMVSEILPNYAETFSFFCNEYQLNKKI